MVLTGRLESGERIARITPEQDVSKSHRERERRIAERNRQHVNCEPEIIAQHRHERIDARRHGDRHLMDEQQRDQLEPVHVDRKPGDEHDDRDPDLNQRRRQASDRLGQFAKFCGVLGKPEWAADPRFAKNADRVRKLIGRT